MLSVRRATIQQRHGQALTCDFYPRPPRGGRRAAEIFGPGNLKFLSTPSARRATLPRLPEKPYMEISIYALREEGDSFTASHSGRPAKFLSTPSARRATPQSARVVADRHYFYPRPPRGGRPGSRGGQPESPCISIHALREEGDPAICAPYFAFSAFLSTPSARRATGRKEGDFSMYQNFYPRPPRGGRPSTADFGVSSMIFLSTPSARRATVRFDIQRLFHQLFLSTPSVRRATGRACCFQPVSSYFYPRPP